MRSNTRLFVYEKALDAVTECEAVSRGVAPSRLDLTDQLRRASTSIALNIAEGAGEFSIKEKLRFYRMARRSATECEAILDVVDRVIVSAPPTAAARRSLDEVLALLTRTAKSFEPK